ncbi:MAG TPA: TetR/AcrR family transcriptional regulator [Acidimicrobiales bacterium]
MARLQGHARNDGTVDPAAQGSGTRERILDISLELFTTQGYDKTSLREIAEQLGFSKAAIYYHFESKEAILMALHMRLHAIGLDALRNIDRETMTLDVWSTLLDQMIEQMLSHRALFIFHERNRTAMEGLHDEKHDAEHDDIESLFRAALANEDIPLKDRVRVSCAFGAVIVGLVMTGDAFADVPDAELGEMLRDIAHGILTPSAADEIVG